MKSIAERLRYARELKGWKQAQLAVAADVSQGTIGNIESGARQSRGSLPKIAKALGVSHDWLADGEGQMQPVGGQVEAPNVTTLPAPALRGLAGALAEVQAAVDGLSPLLQDAGRTVLRKWLDSQASLTDVVATIEGLQQTSATLMSGSGGGTEKHHAA